MSEDNCCSLEMSKKLVEADIVLETDAYWQLLFWSDGTPEWELQSDGIVGDDCIPAPSMAELWRELPEVLPNNTRNYYMKLMIEKSDDLTLVCYGNDVMETYVGEFENVNPADALAGLLIWVKERNNGNQ